MAKYGEHVAVTISVKSFDGAVAVAAMAMMVSAAVITRDGRSTQGPGNTAGIT